MIIVYAVVCSNYEPMEVAELYVWEEEAQKHAEALSQDGSGLPWRVIPWTPRRNYTPEGT